MLTLNDGRSELWQWDTGRTLAVDADCSQVHFSNKVFGRSIDVDVVNGTAVIPDILLQTDKDLNVWAFVGTAENGYTKISKTFTVNRRNKPADYVFTPTEQMTLQTIQSQIGDLSDLTTESKDTLVAAINEAARTGGGISPDAVLYTPQTLTDAQKKQARENVDAASSDFVINGTVTGETLTTDKTYEQVQEAVQAGKRVTLKVKVYGIDYVLPQIGESSSGYLFATAATLVPGLIVQFTAEVGQAGQNLFVNAKVVSYDSDGNLMQATMDSDPSQPMEIATKQYVDASGVPSVTAADNGKVLRVVNSAWSAADMPEALPNPNALTFTGAVTGSYDGSAPLSVEIPDGGSGGYNLPVASATQLGGVMPVAKTDEMTKAVGVDEAGGLWALPGGASRSWRLVGTVDFAELYNQGVTSFEYALSSPDAIYLHQENITNDHDKTNSRLQLQYGGITLGENSIITRNKNDKQNKFNNLCWYFDGVFAKAEKSSESIGINYSFSTLNAMYTLFQPYDGYPKKISGYWSNIPGAFNTIISGTLEIWARELI